MQTRYGTDRVTPGNQSLGKPEIKRFDQDVADKYNGLEAKRREINAQLREGNAEINRVFETIGQVVAEGGEWQKSISRVGKLRFDTEALEAGLRYIDGQEGLLKRSNNWLKLR